MSTNNTNLEAPANQNQQEQVPESPLGVLGLSEETLPPLEAEPVTVADPYTAEPVQDPIVDPAQVQTPEQTLEVAPANPEMEALKLQIAALTGQVEGQQQAQPQQQEQGQTPEQYREEFVSKLGMNSLLTDETFTAIRNEDPATAKAALGNLIQDAIETFYSNIAVPEFSQLVQYSQNAFAEQQKMDVARDQAAVASKRAFSADFPEFADFINNPASAELLNNATRKVEEMTGLKLKGYEKQAGENIINVLKMWGVNPTVQAPAPAPAQLPTTGLQNTGIPQTTPQYLKPRFHAPLQTGASGREQTTNANENAPLNSLATVVKYAKETKGMDLSAGGLFG